MTTPDRATLAGGSSARSDSSATGSAKITRGYRHNYRYLRGLETHLTPGMERLVSPFRTSFGVETDKVCILARVETDGAAGMELAGADTDLGAEADRRKQVGNRRRRQVDHTLVRSILRPGPPIAPTSTGLGARDRRQGLGLQRPPPRHAAGGLGHPEA